MNAKDNKDVDLPPKYREIDIKKPKQLFDYCNLPSKYVFRGQSCYKWDLATSFERKRTGVNWTGWYDLENKMLVEFKRQAHHYISHLPEEDVEWLALMQHYGCPTRLLDFTKSFWIALFFAINDADSDSAVWIVDTSYYIKRDEPQCKDYIISSYNKKAAEEANNILKGDDNTKYEPDVVFVEPFVINQRLSLQQGLFAFPRALDLSFEENLCKKLQTKSFEELKKLEGDTSIFKLKISKKIHGSILSFLSTMNINSSTLYPGLEGFAKSMINHIKFAKYHEEAQKEIMEELKKAHIEWLVNSD